MIDQDILLAFIAESKKHLGTVEADLLALENPADLERVNHLFRALHTMKGGAGFLDMKNVTRLSHALENVVGKARGRELEIGGEVVEALP